MWGRQGPGTTAALCNSKYLRRSAFHVSQPRIWTFREKRWLDASDLVSQHFAEKQRFFFFWAGAGRAKREQNRFERVGHLSPKYCLLSLARMSQRRPLYGPIPVETRTFRKIWEPLAHMNFRGIRMDPSLGALFSGKICVDQWEHQAQRLGKHLLQSLNPLSYLSSCCWNAHSASPTFSESSAEACQQRRGMHACTQALVPVALLGVKSLCLNCETKTFLLGQF